MLITLPAANTRIYTVVTACKILDKNRGKCTKLIPFFIKNQYNPVNQAIMYRFLVLIHTHDDVALLRDNGRGEEPIWLVGLK